MITRKAVAWFATVMLLCGTCLAGEGIQAGDSKYLHPSHRVIMPAWQKLVDECRQINRAVPGLDDYQEIDSQHGVRRWETAARNMLHAKIGLCRSLDDMRDGLDVNESLELNRAMDAILKSAQRIDEGYDYAITAIFLLALIHSEFGNDLTALRWYRKYLEKAPDGPYRDDACLGIGYVHFRAGEYHLVVKQLSRLANAEPDKRDMETFLNATYLLGWSHARLGNKREAVFSFEKIVDALHGEDWLSEVGSLHACDIKSAAFRDMELLYGERPRPRPGFRLAGRRNTPERQTELAREIETIYE